MKSDTTQRRSGLRRVAALPLCLVFAVGLAFASDTGAPSATGGQSTPAQASVAAEGPAATAANSADTSSPPDASSIKDQKFSFRVSGYMRGWASMNLQNIPERNNKGAGDLSMVRGAISINADARTGRLRWKAIVRANGEVKTPYLQGLEDLNQAHSPGGPGSDILGLYNQVELREFYVDIPVTERLNFRIGRQQVVWGETDFFHVMDLIHGFDFRWRSFVERDNDEVRKPLNLLNATLNVPHGTLQFIVRPGSGLNRAVDSGNTFDLSGGRWAPQPFRGFDFLGTGMLTNNYRYVDGDTRDWTGGVRWTGVGGPINYSFSYLRSYNPNPVVNSVFAPYKENPKGGLGDLVFPEINVFGTSASAYIKKIDGVLSAEFAYQDGVPYNVGSNFFGGQLPGFGGIKKKNVIVNSLRFDKQLRLSRYLKTNQPTFFSVQMFNTWITGLKSSDDLVELVGYGAPAKRLTTYLTGFFTLNYYHSKFNPGLAFGTSLVNGDAFVIPSAELQRGNHWRFVLEADFFFPQHQKRPGQVENETRFLGYFAHNDQLVLRTTYQF